MNGIYVRRIWGGGVGWLVSVFRTLFLFDVSVFPCTLLSHASYFPCPEALYPSFPRFEPFRIHSFFPFDVLP